MKRLFQTLIFVFLLSISFAQVQRVVLLEHFTQASCGPCATYNPAIEDLLSNNEGDLVCINYHVWWPGYDPMYFHNTADVQNRAGYYDVGGVPNSVLEGNYYNGHPSGWGQADIDARLSVSSKLNIEITPVFSPNFDSVIVTMKIIAAAGISNAIRAHIAIVEKNIQFSTPPGTNGEKEFSYVMKKMLPDANGTEFQSFVEGETYTVVGRWKIENLYQMNQIGIVAFVQNHNTKEIYQAAYKKLNFAAMYSLDASVKEMDNIYDKVCLSTIKPKVKVQNLGSNNVTSLSFTYSFNNEEAQSFDWQGSLGFYESTIIELPEITYNKRSSNNEFSVSVTKVNGGSDNYAANNIFTKTFDEAPLATNTLYFKFKPDTDPEQSSWIFRKSGGSILYEGGPYSSTQTALIDKTFKVTESGCYELTMLDANNDGLKEGGYYILKDMNDLTIVNGREFFGKETTALEIIGAPQISLNYEDGATDVPTNTVFVLSINESLRKLNDEPIDDIEEYVSLQERAIEGPYIGFSATMNEEANEITITPDDELKAGAIYFISILEGLEGEMNNFLPKTSFGITTASETGINNISTHNAIKLYPNPTCKNVTIEFLHNQKVSSIKIYSLTGQQVYQKNLNLKSMNEIIHINTSSFEKGIYFVKIAAGNNEYFEKLIIK